MGIDTKLYVSLRWNVKDIQDVITLRYQVPTLVKFHDFAPNYVAIQFSVDGGNNMRQLNVHTDVEVGGLPAMQMCFHSNPEGIAILKTLAETFGGIFIDQDTSDDAQIFDAPDTGNAEFVLKEALKVNPELGQGGSKLAEFIVARGWSGSHEERRDATVEAHPVELDSED